MIGFGVNPSAGAKGDPRTLCAGLPTVRRPIGHDRLGTDQCWRDDPEDLRAMRADFGLGFMPGWCSPKLPVRSVEDETAACQPKLSKLTHNGCAVVIVRETSNAIAGAARR